MMGQTWKYFIISSLKLGQSITSTMISLRNVLPTHILPLYNKGNNVNILYVIRRLSDYYDVSWLDAVCQGIGIDKKRVTQRQPGKKMEEFPSLKLQK